MGMREKLLTGELYACDDDSVAAEQATWLEKVYEYNMTRPSEPEKRKAMLKSMFAHLGKGCYIEPPFHANWGGKNVSFGDYVYANFNLTLVDDGVITVGDYTMFGPGVTVATAGHPVLPELRATFPRTSSPSAIPAACSAR